MLVVEKVSMMVAAMAVDLVVNSVVDLVVSKADMKVVHWVATMVVD